MEINYWADLEKIFWCKASRFSLNFHFFRSVKWQPTCVQEIGAFFTGWSCNFLISPFLVYLNSYASLHAYIRFEWPWIQLLTMVEFDTKGLS